MARARHDDSAHARLSPAWPAGCYATRCIDSPRVFLLCSPALLTATNRPPPGRLDRPSSTPRAAGTPSCARPPAAECWRHPPAPASNARTPLIARDTLCRGGRASERSARDRTPRSSSPRPRPRAAGWGGPDRLTVGLLSLTAFLLVLALLGTQVGGADGGHTQHRALLLRRIYRTTLVEHVLPAGAGRPRREFGYPVQLHIGARRCTSAPITRVS